MNHIYRERTEDEGWGPSCLGSFCGIFSPWKKSSKISNSAVGLRCLRLAGRQFAKAWSKRSTQLGLEQTPLDPCFIQISSELANHRFYNFRKRCQTKHGNYITSSKTPTFHTFVFGSKWILGELNPSEQQQQQLTTMQSHTQKLVIFFSQTSSPWKQIRNLDVLEGGWDGGSGAGGLVWCRFRGDFVVFFGVSLFKIEMIYRPWRDHQKKHTKKKRHFLEQFVGLWYIVVTKLRFRTFKDD